MTMNQQKTVVSPFTRNHILLNAQTLRVGIECDRVVDIRLFSVVGVVTIKSFNVVLNPQGFHNMQFSGVR